jgi:membrane fusion protein (multidrug efflux system)
LLRKHLFLILALGVVGLMLLAAGVKLVTDGARGRAGPGAAAGGPGGGGAPRPGGGGPRAVQVNATTAQTRAFVDRLEVLGTAKARQSITLTAPATQLITRLRFQSGDYVRAGQVLAELNAREQDASVAQARSQVALAKSNWDRWQQLADRGIAPAATAEQFKSQYEQAVATLEVNQARVGDRTIRAPFSGTVGLTDAAPGMLINPGAAIATLDDLSVIRVDFPVPEPFIPVLREGLPIQATADAYPAVTFDGRVAKLDTRVDPATRSVNARAEFPNPGNRLKPGMLLRVVIQRAVRQNPGAPEAAVVFESGEAYVLLIQPAPPPGQGGPGGGARQGPPAGGPQAGGAGGQAPQGPRLIAVRHTVTAGLRQDGWIEILAGLQPGQQIVADGTNRVRPNDPVQVVGGLQRPAGAPGGPRPQGAQGAQGGAVAAPAAAGAAAGAGRPDLQAAFQAADANRDGGVTLAEWTAGGRPDNAFARMDANGDGRVTLTEMQAQRGGGRPAGAA